MKDGPVKGEQRFESPAPLIRNDGGQRTVGQKLYPDERKAETKTDRNPSPQNLHPGQVPFKNEAVLG